MNNDEMVLTIRVRRLPRDGKVTEKDFFRLIKDWVDVINHKRARNLDPHTGCPDYECPLNVSCARCWAIAIARFTHMGNNIPVL